MQIKIFTIPILGGEALNEEMNRFLRAKKVLQVESQLVQHDQGGFWSFCVRYVEQVYESPAQKGKVDYKEVLDKASFERYSKLRELRNRLAQEEAIPAFAIFSNEELAGLAKLQRITLSNMKSIKGIGDKKVEKYGQYFVTEPLNEKSQ